MARAVAQRKRRHADILGRSAKDLHGCIERLAALEAFHDKGISRAGRFAALPLTRQQQRVGILPGDILLAARQGETAIDKCRLRQVELAQSHRILAAVRQADDAALFIRLAANGSLPEPVGLLGFRQRIQVDHRAPIRRGALIIRLAGLAPNPMRVVRVLPEVEDLSGYHLGFRDPVLRLEYDLGIVEQRVEPRVAREHGVRLRVLGLHPLHGTLAMRLLEPKKGVVRGSRDGGRTFQGAQDEGESA